MTDDDLKNNRITESVNQMRNLWNQAIHPLFTDFEKKILDHMQRNKLHQESRIIDQQLMYVNSLEISQVERLCDRQLFIFKQAMREAIESILSTKKKRT